MSGIGLVLGDGAEALRVVEHDAGDSAQIDREVFVPSYVPSSRIGTSIVPVVEPARIVRVPVAR